jgi:hypothetical protein
MERDAEIDQIKRELAILRARYAGYCRSALMLKGFFTLLLPVVAVALAIKLFLFDAFYGLFFIGMVFVFAAAIILSLKPAGIRWIDVAAFPFGNTLVHRMYEPYFFYPDAYPKPRNDVELVEMQIKDRERRLRELEKAPSDAR